MMNRLDAVCHNAVWMSDVWFASVGTDIHSDTVLCRCNSAYRCNGLGSNHTFNDRALCIVILGMGVERSTTLSTERAHI